MYSSISGARIQPDVFRVQLDEPFAVNRRGKLAEIFALDRFDELHFDARSRRDFRGGQVALAARFK